MLRDQVVSDQHLTEVPAAKKAPKMAEKVEA
jgi:hypothetical protein